MSAIIARGEIQYAFQARGVSIQQHLDYRVVRMIYFMQPESGTSDQRPSAVVIFYCFMHSFTNNTVHVHRKDGIDSQRRILHKNHK